MVTVDVLQADLGGLGLIPELGHSYYGDNEFVIRDIRLTLRGVPPDQRGLERDQGFWLLTKNVSCQVCLGGQG